LKYFAVERRLNGSNEYASKNSVSLRKVLPASQCERAAWRSFSAQSCRWRYPRARRRGKRNISKRRPRCQSTSCKAAASGPPNNSRPTFSTSINCSPCNGPPNLRLLSTRLRATLRFCGNVSLLVGVRARESGQLSKELRQIVRRKKCRALVRRGILEAICCSALIISDRRRRGLALVRRDRDFHRHPGRVRRRRHQDHRRPGRHRRGRLDPQDRAADDGL
jgi:hypothetical protein